MEWYEKAYVYDVGVAQFVQFVRPLYPPDHPEGPVPDGPDVEAIKRGVSRLNRWPWGTFDRSFSNAFAHGKSGNASESGLEGVQRQAEVAGANGAFGERSHDILLYARIPDGLPHAGEFAYDAYALELLKQAAKIFDEPAPNPNPPTPSTQSPRKKALAHMEKRVGYTENPWGSNFDSRSDGIHKCQDVTAGGHRLDKTAWCGSWCNYALTTAGVKGLGFFMCSVAAIEYHAKSGSAPFKGWSWGRAGIYPGDLAVIGGYGVHVEMVRGFEGSATLTYGGNTSPGTSGSQSNGGGAFRRVRYPSEVRGYAKIRYPGE